MSIDVYRGSIGLIRIPYLGNITLYLVMIL